MYNCLYDKSFIDWTIFKNKFPQVKETESLLSHTFMHTVIQLKSYEPDSECENKKRQTITDDCLWHFFSLPKNEILKKVSISFFFVQRNILYVHNFTLLTAAPAWLMNELHQHLPLYSESLYGDIHYFGLQQKKTKKQTSLTKLKKKSVGTLILWRKPPPPKNLSSIEWEVWTAFAEQQNSMNVT